MPYYPDSGEMRYYSNEPDNNDFSFDRKSVEKRLANHRRRAKDYNVKSEMMTPEDIYKIIKEQSFRCAYSHDPLDDSWEIEHKVEMVNGGSNTLDNMTVVNRHWNRSKGSRGLDYLVEKGEAEETRHEHYEMDDEFESDLGYLTYQWNKNYRDAGEPLTHIDKSEAYRDKGLSLEDLDLEERSTIQTEEDALNWILGEINSNQQDDSLE